MTIKKTTIIFLVASTILLIVSVTPGRLPHTDDAYFKEPAYNLGEHGELASPALKGYAHLTPDISETFAVYQPGYTLCYAMWINVFPHSFRSAVAFDSTIRFFLVLTLFFVLQNISKQADSRIILFAALLPWLMGTPARPDELAMICGYWGLHLLNVSINRNRIFALSGGLILGLCGSISIPVLTIFLIFIATVQTLRIAEGSYNKEQFMHHTLAALAFLATLLAFLVPFYMRDGAWAQYKQISSVHFLAAITRSFEARSLEPFIMMMLSAIRSSIFQFPLYATASLTTLFLLIKKQKTTLKKELLGCLVAYIFIFITLPQQYLYYWFLFPLIITLLLNYTGIRSVMGISLITLTMIASNPTIRDSVKVQQIVDTQRETYLINEINTIIPENAAIFASTKNYYLLRHAYKNITLDHWNDWTIMKNVDYCVFGGWLLTETDNVRLPVGIASQDASHYLKTHFREELNALPTNKPTLLGIPIGSEPVGYGVIIYKRTQPDDPIAPHNE